MRYVIVIVSIAFFIVWDGLYNRGEYVEQGVRMLTHAFRWVGL